MEGFPQHQSLSRLGHVEFLEIDEEDVDTKGLHAHVLSPAARHSLLSDRHPWTSSLNTNTPIPLNAETLLEDLHHLSPGVAKNFASKVAASVNENLVFKLINDVRHAGNEKSYIAMSYCWKKVHHEVPRTEVSPVGDLPFGWVKTVERFPLPVGEALFQAVLRERVVGEGLWFDQVCIDQQDEIEKATAIGAIDSIYRNARTVVVALDDISIDEDEAAFLHHYLDQYSQSDLPNNQQPNSGLNPPFMHRHTLFHSFFERILSSIWFERAWCAHEMRMGRSHVFLVPCTSNEDDESFTFIRFTGAFFLHMLLLASELKGGNSSQTQKLRTLLELFARRSILDERDAITLLSPGTNFTPIPNSISFVPMIPDIFKLKAGGNPRLPEHLRRLDANRDRISIALNDAGLPLVLKPSSPLQRPTIEHECLRQLLLIGLAARDPVTLCTTGTPLQLHDGSVSWLCRPTPLDVPLRHRGLPRISSNANPITQGSDGRAEYVQLDLLFLDLPHRTHPNPHFPTHIQRARAFVDVCIQYQLPCASTMWSSWQVHGHERAAGMQNIFAQTLACCYDCGPQWLLDVSTSLQPNSQSTGLTPQMVDTLCNPRSIIHTYVRTTEGHEASTLLLDFLSLLITRGIPWASGATERSHGPLITSLLFAPFRDSKTLLVAVPDALISTHYSELARAWILVPMSGYTASSRQMVSWTLQGKAVLFGGRSFGVGLEGVDPGMRRCHRVFGGRG
ncbi:hypothetical protein K505DRAFT_345393 [Melanomma pulvis-pyrius CBS 109.77]|uniref:Heterokaryon incompatibility domain-containing protein n=1 Tax=Melanomma pulvis-pyrius CBS 109.77 TaxID=1314802 RepID=A0A6A6XWJ2_9PLEO|nr:hypothetical protein K505DRAFT_345393 [Melanomma pulvis-pyrius CBS 109.77]